MYRYRIWLSFVHFVSRFRYTFPEDEEKNTNTEKKKLSLLYMTEESGLRRQFYREKKDQSARE